MNMLRTKSQWEDLTERIGELSEIIGGADAGFKSVKTTGAKFTEVALKLWDRLWFTHLGKLFMRVIAVACGILSILVIWSEITIFIHHLNPTVILSPFGSVIQYLVSVNTYDTTVLLVTMIPLAYMNMCLQGSLKKVKLPFVEHTYLYPRQHTDGYALAYNACYACRMQFALSYNYFMCLQVPNLYSKTALFAVMGPLKFVPILGGEIFLYLPIAFIFVAFFNTFDVGSKILKKIGIDIAGDPNPKSKDHMDLVREIVISYLF
jgi:hypothetical protein